MFQLNVKSRKPTAAVFTVLVACIGITACGGSSTGTSSQSKATTAASATSPATGGGARFGALRQCLQQNGITLPQRKPGQGPGGGLLGGGAGRQLPKGVTQAQFEAAIKKCGGGFLRRGRPLSPASVQGYTKFAACMRANGVNLPAPNTSGKGPVFNTSGLNTSSPQFRQAQSKCASDLTGTSAGRPPAGGPPPGGGEGAGPGGAGT
jgi:hypothetical protein